MNSSHFSRKLHQAQETNMEETEKYNELRYILPMFLGDFIDDFQFSDIHYHVNSKGIIFTEDEVKSIAAISNEEHQVIMMFHILSKNKNLKSFLNILRDDYPWLHEKLENELASYLEGNKKFTKYLNVVHELKSRIPKHSDNNVRRIDYFARTRDYLKRLRPWHYVVLYGDLGLGKQWLALDTCCDYSVIEAMDFKIFWLDVQKCDSKEMDLEQLQRLKIMLGETSLASKIGDYEGISNKILELQQDLKTILQRDEFKDCLLVLRDAQNCKTIDAFKLPCKILITTRNKKVRNYLPRSQSNIINIERGLTKLESFELFERVLEQESKEFPDILQDIFEYSNSHPFLLNIIAQNLKEDNADKWNIWTSNLQKFRIKNNRINTVIEMSFKVLKPDELELYHTLSIFHHSVKIPVSVLAAFWDKTLQDTESLIDKFDRYSLVNKIVINKRDTENTTACLIHILYYNYLKNCVQYDKTYLNKCLVESYRIEEALRNRTEINIPIIDDNYFYYYIGYHLKEAKMTNLFPKLYLDFGFLGQKLRATGLPNTIGDMKYFQKEITCGDSFKEDLVECLHDFLPNIEEMLFKSNDTYLLQYALMTNGTLHFEAIKQCRQFKHRIWFSDSDHFHRRRQIVPLREKPKLVNLIEPNTCLVALEGHSILVADLSLNYSSKPTCFVDHDSDILKMVLFSKNHFLSLDQHGNIRIWSIVRERRESVNRKGSLHFVVNQIDYSTCMKARQRQSVQLIRANGGLIQCFFIELDADDIYLHTVLSNGAIQIHKWNHTRNAFDAEYVPALETRTINVKFILRVMNIYMILNKNGVIKFFNVRDGSECFYDFQWPSHLKNPINVHHYYLDDANVVILFVFASKVFQVQFPLIQNSNTLLGKVEIVYEVNENESITCSVLSDDKRYLIVGMKQGILVLDAMAKAEILRNSVSDNIICVDIYSLDDDIYKYMIISGSKDQKQLNIIGLKQNGNQSLTWANSIGTFVNECNLNLQFEPTAWLVGKKLFDVILKDDKTLVAIDSKNRIHHLCDQKWSMILPFNIRDKVTVVKALDNKYYYGCQSGAIYDSNEIEFDLKLDDSIKFLKVFENEFFVTATAHKSVIKRGDHVVPFGKPIVECYLLSDDYLLFITHNSSIGVQEMTGDFEIRAFINKENEHNGHVACVDFKVTKLALVKYNSIYIYKIETANEIEIVEKSCLCDNDNAITAIEMSADADLCAVGYSNGLIEIYKTEPWQLVQRLRSHHSKIFDMKFSPWSSSNLPVLLASISEQICFWDITYGLNNPLPIFIRNEHSSSRFNSHKEKHKSLTKNNDSGYDVTDGPNTNANCWSNKRGADSKPELLSCIKFTGNKAEKLYTNEEFTQFVTIDDEGEIYFFKVNENLDDDESENGFRYSNGNVQI